MPESFKRLDAALNAGLRGVEDSSQPLPEPFNPRQDNRIFRTLTSSHISANDVKKDTENLQQNGSLQGVWPERLLHVESMVSYKRQQRLDGVFYNGVRKPAFSIVSYKWGLRVKIGGSTLQIKNINWDPPSIDPSYFTVADQTRLLKKLGDHFEFVWLDVACITQLLMEDTLREIIIEPQYFSQASQRYIWWVDFPSDVLKQLLDAVFEAGEAMNKALERTSALDEDELELTAAPAILTQVFDPLTELMSIPWFSSNWTLREIMLCNNVVILNREGDTVPINVESETPATIQMIAALCVQVLSWLQRIESRLRMAASRSQQAKILDAAANQDLAALPFSSELRGSLNNGTLTIAGIASHYIRMVERHGPFFLFSSSPSTLHYWTKALLETGRMIHQGIAGDRAHRDTCVSYGNDQPQYHGWGEDFKVDCHCSVICACTGDFRHSNQWECENTLPQRIGCPGDVMCIPCVLGISIEVKGRVFVDVHTPIAIDTSKIK